MAHPAARYIKFWFKSGPYIEAYNTAVEQLEIQANDLVQRMKDRAPVYAGPEVPGVESGALKSSIRTEPGQDKLHIRVVAGGSATTHGSTSKSYDYANAVEFGTQNMRARPFFFSTHRAMKRRMREVMKEKLGHVMRDFSAENNE